MEIPSQETNTEIESGGTEAAERMKRKNAERAVLTGLAGTVKRLAALTERFNDYRWKRIKEAEPIILRMIADLPDVDVSFSSSSWRKYYSAYDDELEKLFGIGRKYGGDKHRNTPLGGYIPFTPGSLGEFARILRESGEVSLDKLFSESSSPLYGLFAVPFNGAVRTALEFLRHKPDLVLIAPNAGFLPAVMARDALRQPDIRKEVGADYAEPYFLYPGTKSFKRFREMDGSRDWRDFELLIEEYDSPESIPDAVPDVPERTYNKGKEGVGRLRVRRPEVVGSALRDIYRDMERIADAIAVRVRSKHDQPVKLLIYDEASYQGKTVSDLRAMVAGALSILVRRGVISDRDMIQVSNAWYPFGNKRIASEGKIELVDSKKGSTSQENKHGFAYAEAVSDVLAGALLAILRDEAQPTEREYNDTSGGGGIM